MKLRARSALVALVWAASGCVLVVTPEETTGTRCRFAGEDRQCGRCLADQCRAAIDGACFDEDTMADLERCADKRECEPIARRATATPSNAAAVCATTTCAGVCRTTTGVSKTSCKEPSLGRASSCECTFSSTSPPAPDGVVCDTTAYPTARCCAPAGWPADGLKCACTPYVCFPTADGCGCGLSPGAAVESQVCKGQHCCVDGENCRCGAQPCLDFQTPVPSCSLEVAACKKGQALVDSCSVR